MVEVERPQRKMPLLTPLSRGSCRGRETETEPGDVAEADGQFAAKRLTLPSTHKCQYNQAMEGF